ncbi:uncharacterized protein LOC131843648 isoform X2 [Achroia grisella]|uniref:uncharacterized protein LOC131843648 isoform X2 n=1 Tax=Achroia grisella TaxID=688607 RepID=UPI0027D28C66|nr:uncharacterized protein LOC131843648 isoform X2 [Achroia grisella]
MAAPSIKSDLKEPSLQFRNETSRLTQNEAKTQAQGSFSGKDVPMAVSLSESPPSASPQILNSGKAILRSNGSDKLSVKSFKSNQKSPRSLSYKSENTEDMLKNIVINLEPQGKEISDHVDELKESVRALSKNIDCPQSPVLGTNVDKIAAMGEILTKEANALRQSIKSLSEDIARTKQDLCIEKEDVNFPYHLFLIEIVINKIQMKCECFDIDYNNLVITASFLGKQPITLYDASYGKIDDFNKMNAGKSTLFAMTYDKICSIKEFEIMLQLTKQPPCSNCVTNIGETHMDFTGEFNSLREELCKKWTEEQPNDNILCTTSTPLTKNLYYLSCGNENNVESIGVIEVTVRISFLGKEITTAFCSPKPHGASFLLKEDNGMTMYSCHKVEMDDHGKILLDEDVLTKKRSPYRLTKRSESPISQLSSMSFKRYIDPPCMMYTSHPEEARKRYDEIFTKINANELKIRVPKSNRVERMGKYDKIQELCSCESTPYNAGEQIQFEMPPDLCKRDKTHNTYSSNLKYTYRGCDNTCGNKDNKIINVTPTTCTVPVEMEKVIHPQKDVFILKIGKKLETKDKKTDLEIELVTPKGPSVKPIENNNISQQCSPSEIAITKKTKTEKKKLKGKTKQKGKTGKPKKK